MLEISIKKYTKFDFKTAPEKKREQNIPSQENCTKFLFWFCIIVLKNLSKFYPCTYTHKHGNLYMTWKKSKSMLSIINQGKVHKRLDLFEEHACTQFTKCTNSELGSKVFVTWSVDSYRLNNTSHIINRTLSLNGLKKLVCNITNFALYNFQVYTNTLGKKLLFIFSWFEKKSVNSSFLYQN